MSTEMMRVMWCERPQEVELRQIPIHAVGTRMSWSGSPTRPSVRGTYERFRPLLGGLPRILGHEVSGTVAAVGDKVKNVRIGQPVAPDMIIKCGTCRACRSGRSNRCQRPTYLQYGGGYADTWSCPSATSTSSRKGPASRRRL